MLTIQQVDLGRTDSVFSAANVTDIHDDLYFAALPSDDIAARQAALHERGFGIWSIQWSADGREIISGTSSNEQAICVFDMERSQVRMTYVWFGTKLTADGCASDGAPS